MGEGGAGRVRRGRKGSNELNVSFQVYSSHVSFFLTEIDDCCSNAEAGK